MGQMNRDIPFVRYLHDDSRRAEVPMHRHRNGQLGFISSGTVRLISPHAAWMVPWKRIIWIPPDKPHSVQSENLSGGWKIMIPRTFRKHLPAQISVLKASNFLIAALEQLPTSRKAVSPARLRLLRQVILQELMTAECESFGVTLPRDPRLAGLIGVLLKNPEDPRHIDDWAASIGMSRRTFTRFFTVQTGSSFGVWKRNLLLGKSLGLLTQGLNISQVADQLGYANPSAFIMAFRKQYGSSPRRFMRELPQKDHRSLIDLGVGITQRVGQEPMPDTESVWPRTDKRLPA